MNIRERVKELRNRLDYKCPCDCWDGYRPDCQCGKPEDAAEVRAWANDAKTAARIDAILADWPEPTGDWRDEIPWSALRPEIKWVAASKWGVWLAYDDYPGKPTSGVFQRPSLYRLSGVDMPPAPTNWQESKVRRPEVDDESRNS